MGVFYVFVTTNAIGFSFRKLERKLRAIFTIVVGFLRIGHGFYDFYYSKLASKSLTIFLAFPSYFHLS